MHAVQRGEVSLLSELFERHHRTLYRYCWRMTGQTQYSEDLVQEVFLRVLRHRHTFGKGNSFSAWMFAIARNAHLDAWRKRRRERPIEPALALAADNGVSPERRQDQARLHQAMLELPEDRREVLIMSRFLGMTHGEIAEVLGCDEVTSRTRLHRALSELRVIFESRRRVS